jgi:hypothetical protein
LDKLAENCGEPVSFFQGDSRLCVGELADALLIEASVFSRKI